MNCTYFLLKILQKNHEHNSFQSTLPVIVIYFVKAHQIYYNNNKRNKNNKRNQGKQKYILKIPR